MSTESQSPEKSSPNPSRIDIIKRDAAGVITNDLLGKDDWKNSKLGFLTGFSSMKRSVRSIGSTFSDSSDRVSLLVNTMTQGNDLPELEDGGTAEERFALSMALHGKREKDIPIILRNTYYSTLMYAVLTIAYVCILGWSLWSYPPRDVLGVLVRVGPLPLIMALLFKHGYTNWMVRNRRLDSALAFIRSGDLAPKK